MVEKLASQVEQWLDLLYIDAPGAGLREEDRRKAVEVTALLFEIERAASRFSKRLPLVLVDAAAGKSYVGLLAAKLVLEPLGRLGTVVTIERDARRVASSLRAVGRLQSCIPIECRTGDLANISGWPQRPSIVAALHACGPAADAVIERVIESEARMLLLVPCCTSDAVDAAVRARNGGDRLGIPRHAAVRRRFIQALVDAERTWRLEAAGYETEVVELVSPTVTPHNLLWRARRVKEPSRMAAAQRALTLLHSAGRKTKRA